MKALTLTQPWATLVAYGEKRIETRSWMTHYRGPLAIHAGKGFPLADRNLCGREPFRSALRRVGLGGLGLMAPEQVLPRGAVVAIVNLSSVTPTETIDWRYPPSHATPDEEAFGDYSPGRYLWVLEDVVRLDAPLVARGSLGLWTPEPGVIAVLEAYAPPWVPLEERV